MAPNTPLSTRALVVSLKSPFGGKSTSEIAKETGLSTRTINSIYARAIQRGFEPNEPLKIDDRYLVDAPRAGRPRKDIAESLI
jgi:transposase